MVASSHSGQYDFQFTAQVCLLERDVASFIAVALKLFVILYFGLAMKMNK